jgi:excisionase family DNA binding protein
MTVDELTEKDIATLAERLRPHLQSDGKQSDERLLTPSEAAERLGVHPKTLTRAAKQGRVDGAERAGRSWRFNGAELRLRPPENVHVTPPPPRSRQRPAVSTAAAAIRGARTNNTNGRTA